MKHKLTQDQIRQHLAAHLESAAPGLREAMTGFLNAVDSKYLEFENQNRQLQYANNELTYLFKIERLLHGLESVRPVLPELLDHICAATGFPLASMEFYNREKRTLELGGIRGAASANILSMPLATSELPYSQILVDGEDLYAHADFRTAGSRSNLWVDLNASSLICVPMVSSHLVWGTLTIAHPEPNMLTDRTLKWLQSVAGQIATLFERERLQALNQQQQAFIVTASKMSELGKMAGGIAHEINTPLGTIRLMTETLLESGSAALEDPLWANSLAKIVETVERISAIVKGLRAFSREGSADPFIRADMKQMVNGTLALCGEKFRQRSVKFILECPENIEVACRETQISQLLLNLLGNAYDAIKTQADPWISIQVEDHGPCVQLTVTDSGPGIARDLQEKIFLPFFTTKKVGDGTGLGLSICMGIVDAHGGRIELDVTSPNTRFVIFLPKDPASEKKVAV